MTHRDIYPFFSLATLLLGGSWLYGGMIRLRRRMYESGALASLRLPCPVISVGNLVVGGAGKTPMVMHLAELISKWGYRPAIISRGYKGIAEKGGAVISDGHSLLCDARQAGDEPYLMAFLMPAVPVLVGRDRYTVGMKAVEHFNPDVLLLDDGFQHLRLRRDLNILLLDAQHPFGNTHLMPRGTLREPADALERSDLVVLTRCQQMSAESYSQLRHRVHPRPIFASTHRSLVRKMLEAHQPIEGLDSCGEPFTNLKGEKVFAFAGLGRNDAFFASIAHRGANLQGAMGFDDHHRYSVDDLGRIGKAARRSGAEILITTDKDFVRLPQNERVPLKTVVMGVTLDFGEQQLNWNKYIRRTIEDLMGR